MPKTAESVVGELDDHERFGICRLRRSCILGHRIGPSDRTLA
jgi:hypothetical protein